jgi:uncharacterized caspase-like protein
VLITRCTRCGLVSLAALSITGVAGIISADEADTTREQNRRVVERHVQTRTSETDDRRVEEHKVQTPWLHLQTDRAMEQSSKVLEQVTGEKGLKQR